MTSFKIAVRPKLPTHNKIGLYIAKKSIVKKIDSLWNKSTQNTKYYTNDMIIMHKFCIKWLGQI